MPGCDADDGEGGLLARFNSILLQNESELAEHDDTNNNKENERSCKPSANHASQSDTNGDGGSTSVDSQLDEADAYEMMSDSAWSVGSRGRAVQLLEKAVELAYGALTVLLRQRQRELSLVQGQACGSCSPPVLAQVTNALAKIKKVQGHCAELQSRLAERRSATNRSEASPASAGQASAPAWQCQRCRRQLVTSVTGGDAPRFCSHCGSPTPPRLSAVATSPTPQPHLVARRLY